MIALSDERVDWHLWNWERWQACSADRLGYPSRASGGMIGYHNLDRDNDEAYTEMDRSSGACVQALLDGMVPRLRLAVYVRHGIAAVYRLRCDLDVAYAEARAYLAIGLARRSMF